MKEFDTQHVQAKNWEYAMSLSKKPNPMNKATVKGSQFEMPYLEFSGACPGCGETPYLKLITQFFGNRMMIANATGCSSIWGGSAPSTPFAVDKDGRGPAWANSLFEDNAEFGLGMYFGVKQIQNKIQELCEALMTKNVDDAVKAACQKWIDSRTDGEASEIASAELVAALESIDTDDAETKALKAELLEKKDYMVKRSFWIVGGDGWAYDIGFGGLDHVLASGEDVNVLVFDTEVYSNTGGQASKATPTGSVAQFAAAGKPVGKKDLGRIAMSYGYVYVAQVAMGANQNQLIKAITEAEKYNGPSLIIAYAPCINHGIKAGMGCSQAQEKKAVESGYWYLYRYNPELLKENKNPFVLDSKEPRLSYQDFLMSESRYARLVKEFPERAKELFKKSEEDAKFRYEAYKKMAEQN
jgi:pyruvate-ferredoxin/flavodoxin oxidoreductase